MYSNFSMKHEYFPICFCDSAYLDAHLLHTKICSCTANHITGSQILK